MQILKKSSNPSTFSIVTENYPQNDGRSCCSKEPRNVRYQKILQHWGKCWKRGWVGEFIKKVTVPLVLSKGNTKLFLVRKWAEEVNCKQSVWKERGERGDSSFLKSFQFSFCYNLKYFIHCLGFSCKRKYANEKKGWQKTSSSARLLFDLIRNWQNTIQLWKCFDEMFCLKEEIPEK